MEATVVKTFMTRVIGKCGPPTKWSTTFKALVGNFTERKRLMFNV